MNVRFALAMSAYAVLALAGAFTLTGQIRLALWIFLGGLAAEQPLKWREENTMSSRVSKYRLPLRVCQLFAQWSEARENLF